MKLANDLVENLSAKVLVRANRLDEKLHELACGSVHNLSLLVHARVETLNEVGHNELQGQLHYQPHVRLLVV